MLASSDPPADGPKFGHARVPTRRTSEPPLPPSNLARRRRSSARRGPSVRPGRGSREHPPQSPPAPLLGNAGVRFVSSAVDAPSGVAFLGSWEGPSRRCRETRHEPTLRRVSSDEAAHTSRRAAPKGPPWRRIGRGSGCWRCCGRAGSPGSTGMDLAARTGCESESTRRFRTNLAERNQKKRITGER